MLCVCRRGKELRRSIEVVGMSLSCLPCQTAMPRVSIDDENDKFMCCGSRCVCVEVVGCWSRRGMQRSAAKEQQQEEEEEEEEEERQPMSSCGGIVIEDGQPPPTEPRLMRCRAVRRDWNLDDLCKGIGVA